MEQHPDPPPDHARQGTDQCEEIEQCAVPVKNVMIPKRVEVTVALEAACQTTQAAAGFEKGDVTEAGAR
jgi:hypothetical protein